MRERKQTMKNFVKKSLMVIGGIWASALVLKIIYVMIMGVVMYGPVMH